MPHALAAHLGASYLDTTLIADDALETDALVFAARAFPVLRRTKDALAEQAVLLRAQCAIVDGLRLRHLAIAPRANLLGAGEADTDGVKIIDFKHWGRRWHRPIQRATARACLLSECLPDTLPVAGAAGPHLGDAPTAREARTPPAPHLGYIAALRLSPLFFLKTTEIDAQVRHQIRGRIFHKLDLLLIFVEHLDINAEALQLLDQHLERLWHTWLDDWLTLDDGLIRLDTASHVVRLDGQDLLQDVGGAVGFERPHLHLAEPLAAELRLATQRLLRDEAVGASRAGMHLVFDQVGQLEHVDVANRHRGVEWLTRAPIIEPNLAFDGQVSLRQPLFDVGLRGAIEDRRGDMVAQRLRRPAQVRLHNLPDVHAVRHTQRIQNDINWRAIGQEWHILHRQHTANNALVAVATRHLVARADLTLLRYSDTHQMVHTRRQIVVVFAREDLDLDHLATLAMRYAQRCVFHITRLLTKDRAQQLLLSGQLRLALRRDFAYQDVAWADLRADIDDAALIQITQAIFAHVRDIARDLLRAELGVARLDLVLLDVNAGEQILAHDMLAEEDGVLEIAALPHHEGDQDVLAQRQFAVLRRGAIGDGLAQRYTVALGDDRALIDAGAIVRANELAQLVRMLHAVIVQHDDLPRRHADDLASRFGQRHLTRILRDLQ